MVGSGMMNPNSNIVPVPCYSCERLTKIDVNNQELKCSRCKKDVELFEPFLSDNKDVVIEEMKFKCPKCGEEKLEFIDVGLWD